MVSCTLGGWATSITKILDMDIDLPTDPLTIEALIALHKEQIEMTQWRANQAAVEMAQQSELTKKMKKLDQVKDTLEERVKGAFNWMTFAANLNKMRLNLETIYDLEKELTDTIQSWLFRVPRVEKFSMNGLKRTYNYATAQAMVLFHCYNTLNKSYDQLKALLKIFAVQFSGEMATATFSGAWKNLTVNLATDKERRDFTNRVFYKQDEIIGTLMSGLKKIKYVAWGLVKIDMVGSLLNMLDYEVIAEEVIDTYYV